MISLELHPTGSRCYDETGITFPEHILVNWDVLLRGHTWWWFEPTPNLPRKIAVRGMLSNDVIKQLDILHIIVRP